MGNMIDETGNQYGKLTVLRPTADKTNGWIHWLCQCECGETRVVAGAYLRLGKVKSCGCYRYSMYPNGEKAFTLLYARLRSAAKRREFIWELTREQVKELTQQNCYYCGVKPTQMATVEDTSYAYNGLDRVDNEQGYTLENVVPCCGTCNRAKLSRTQEEFYLWIRRIYEKGLTKD